MKQMTGPTPEYEDPPQYPQSHQPARPSGYQTQQPEYPPQQEPTYLSGYNPQAQYPIPPVQQYPYPQYQVAPKTNTCAVLAIIFSILFAVAGLVLSIVAITQINNAQQEGRVEKGETLAYVALCISIVNMIIGGILGANGVI